MVNGMKAISVEALEVIRHALEEARCYDPDYDVISKARKIVDDKLREVRSD